MHLAQTSGSLKRSLGMAYCRLCRAQHLITMGISSKGVYRKVRRILVGTIIWTLGILIPVLQHGIISLVASRATTHSYAYHNLVKYFFALPWLIWVYLIAMWLVGTILVISGLFTKSSQQ